MIDPSLDYLVRELEAARELLRRNGGAGSLTFRITRDRTGVERVTWQIEVSEPSKLLTGKLQLDDVHPAAQAPK